LVSLLNAQPMGFWSPQSLVADAKRHGVSVLRPDVNRSKVGAATQEHEGQIAVRLGLGAVRGIGSEVAERIVNGAPWRDQNDLVRRANLQQSHLESLASAGALDDFGNSRRALIWSAGAASQGTSDRLEGVVTGLSAPTLFEPSPIERVADDLWSMGLTTEATAMELMREELSAREVVTAASLSSSTARRVTVAGVVTHRQRPETARGAVFLNLEDETGHVNVVFSKGAWIRWREMADSSPALIIRGTLERGQGTVNVTAEFVEPLQIGAVTPSRDWH